MDRAPYDVDEPPLERASDDAVRIWEENLASMGSGGRSKLAWFYEASPGGRGHVLLLRDPGGAPVGCVGVGFRRMARHGRPLRAALLADLAVDARHRSLAPVLGLLRRAGALAASEADVQYGFPNEAAVGVFQRVGYRLLGRMARYARVLRFAPYVARAVPVPLVARAAGAALDLVDAIRGLAPRLGAATRYRLEPLPAPSPRVDALFEDAQRGRGLLGDRRAESLRWRFFTRAAGAELLALVRRGDGAVRAWAIVTRRGDVAHLRDFLGASDAELDALLALLLPALRARGCTSASTRFLGDPRIPALLARRGFRRREAERAVVVAAGRSPLPADLEDAASWYLTDADEDE